MKKLWHQVLIQNRLPQIPKIFSMHARIVADAFGWNALWQRIVPFIPMLGHSNVGFVTDRKWTFQLNTKMERAIAMHFHRFKRRKLLRVHMRIHFHYPTIECDICGKLFRRNIQRDNHIKERHNAPVPKRIKKPPPPPKARKLSRRSIEIPLCRKSRLFLKFAEHCKVILK